MRTGAETSLWPRSRVPVAAGSTCAMVADTLPFGNRFGLPFTPDALKRAQRPMAPEDEAEMQTRLIYEPDPEAIGIADLNLRAFASSRPGYGRSVRSSNSGGR